MSNAQKLPVVFEGSDYTSTLSVVIAGTTTPFPLPGAIQVDFYRFGETSPFLSSTLANGRLGSVNASGGIIVFDIPAADLASIGPSLGTATVRRTDVPEIYFSFNVRYADANEALSSDYSGDININMGNIAVAVSPSLPPVAGGPSFHVHPNATTSIAGFMSATDKAIVDGVTAGLASKLNVSAAAETAQDAVGAMVNSTLLYNDATPSLERAAITGAVSVPLGSNTAALGSFTMAQLGAAVSDEVVPRVNEISKGIAALDRIPPNLRSTKMMVLDFENGGYAHINGGGQYELRSIENIPSLTLTNSTGGEVISRKRVRSQTGANALRYTHAPDGTPRGALFEEAYSYMHPRSQPTVAQLGASGGVADATTPSGESGAWIQFVLGGSAAYAYAASISYTSGVAYHIQAEIIMDDGLAPTPSNSSVSGDFSVYLGNTINLLNPDTGLTGFKIIGPMANNKYIVQGYMVASTTLSQWYGLIKHSTQSSRGFRVGRVNVGPGRYPPSMFDNATGTPNSRAADNLTLLLSDITSDEMTLLLECVMPPNDALTHWPFSVYGDRVSGGGIGYFIISATAATPQAIYGDSTISYPSISVSPHAPGDVVRIAARLSRSRGKTSIISTGRSIAHSAAGDFPAFSLQYIWVGQFSGAYHHNSPIRLCAVIDRSLSDSEMASWVD